MLSSHLRGHKQAPPAHIKNTIPSGIEGPVVASFERTDLCIAAGSRWAMRGGSRGSRGRYGTCAAAALIDLRETGASRGGGSGWRQTRWFLTA